MNHNPKATANALATVAGGLYLICAIWTLVSRDSFIGVIGTWAHGVDLNALPAKTPDFGTLIIGFITFVIASWLTGYAFVYAFNYFAKKN